MHTAKSRLSRQEEDLISGLPDGVLSHIISFLPLKQAVQTSLLSSRWRNIYTYLSTLNVDFGYFKRPRSEAVAFMEFVDHVITSHAGFVEKFVININHDILIDLKFVTNVINNRKSIALSDCDRVDRWIRHALDNKVKELDLRILLDRLCIKVDVPMPIEIFTCKTLEVLKLCGHRTLKLPPNYICCLPNVKSLHLAIGFFDEDSFQRLVSSCSVLEDLVMGNCHFKGHRKKFNVFNRKLKRLTISYVLGTNCEYGIDAPNLVYTKCCCNHLAQSFKTVSNYQVEVAKDVRTFPNYDRYYSIAFNLFKGLTHVQSLHLSGIFAEVLLQGNGIIPKLPNLTYLILDSFAGWERILPDFLTYFPPPIKTLHFKVDLLHSRNIDTITLPSSLWSNLKRLEIFSFEDIDYNGLQIVDYFLMNAQFLEHFTAHTSKTMKAEKRSKFIEEVFELPKFSENCKILVV